MKATRHDKERQTLKKIEELIGHYGPEVIVVEEFSIERSRRVERIRHLLKSIAELAKGRGIRVRTFSGVQVRKAVAGDERATKHQMARIIAERFPELARRVPRYRKPWMSEDYRQSIFDAVGIAVTSFCRGQKSNGTIPLSGHCWLERLTFYVSWLSVVCLAHCHLREATLTLVLSGWKAAVTSQEAHAIILVMQLNYRSILGITITVILLQTTAFGAVLRREDILSLFLAYSLQIFLLVPLFCLVKKENRRAGTAIALVVATWTLLLNGFVSFAHCVGGCPDIFVMSAFPWGFLLLTLLIVIFAFKRSVSLFVAVCFCLLLVLVIFTPFMTNERIWVPFLNN